QPSWYGGRYERRAPAGDDSSPGAKKLWNCPPDPERMPGCSDAPEQPETRGRQPLMSGSGPRRNRDADSLLHRAASTRTGSMAAAPPPPTAGTATRAPNRSPDRSPSRSPRRSPDGSPDRVQGRTGAEARAAVDTRTRRSGTATRARTRAAGGEAAETLAP